MGWSFGPLCRQARVVRGVFWFARGFFFMGWSFGPLCGGGGGGGGSGSSAAADSDGGNFCDCGGIFWKQINQEKVS